MEREINKIQKFLKNKDLSIEQRKSLEKKLEILSKNKVVKK